MERYSILQGTDVAGAYSMLGCSKGIDRFLRKIGATDMDTTINLVREQLRGFQELPGYENEPMNAKPVAVRYAPMHLYKKSGLSSMKPFCALSINGAENRHIEQQMIDGKQAYRNTQYNHTFILSRDLVRENGEFCYLDFLFGTRLISWQDVEAHRNKKEKVNFEEPPRKVEPRISRKDRVLVLQTAEAIYQGKNVIIRLEKRYGFNQRAMELLAGIYSLLQPRLASEVGFASYQNPAAVTKMAGEISVRIFVIPAEAAIPTVSADQYLIIDLSEEGAPKRLEPTPVATTLNEWLDFPWERRKAALHAIFSNVEDFQNPTIFVERSKQFFDAAHKLDQWQTEHGNFASLKDLKSEYETSIQSSCVPWAEEVFRKALPHMLAEGQSLAVLVAEAAAGVLNKNGEEKKTAAKDYQFGHQFADVDVVKFHALIKEHTEVTESEKWSDLLAKQNEHFRGEMKSIKDAYIAQIAEQKRDFDTALAESQQKIVDAQEKIDSLTEQNERTLAAQKKKHEETLAAQKQVHEETLVAQKKEHEETLAACERQHAVELVEADQKYRQLQEKAKNAYLNEKKRADQAIKGLETAEQKHQAELNAARKTLLEEKERGESAVEAERRRGKAEIAKLQDEIAKNDSTLRKLKTDLADAERKLSRCEEEIKRLRNGTAETRLRILSVVLGVLLVVSIAGNILLWIMPHSAMPGKEEQTGNDSVLITQPTKEPTSPTTVDPGEMLPLDWTRQETALWFMEQIPALDCVTTDITQMQMIEEVSVPEEYDICAQFVLKANDLGDIDSGSQLQHALLIQKRSQEQEIVTPAETLLSSGFGSDAEISMVLGSQDYVIAVFGDTQMQKTAMEILALIEESESRVQILWNDQFGMLDISAVAEQLEADPQWWRAISNIVTDEEILLTGSQELGLGESPYVCFDCESAEILLFRYDGNMELVQELSAKNLEQQWKLSIGDQYIAILNTKNNT